MFYVKKSLFVLLIFLSSGCSWFNKHSNTPTELSQFVDQGKILDAKRLKDGGKILIIPFKAGEEVEANNQLDRISLMIVKGIAEELKANNSNFTILDSSNADTADLVIRGYITYLDKPSMFKKWILRKDTKKLSSEGRMTDEETGRTVLIFSDTKKSKDKSSDYNDLGLSVGQDIGRFISSGSH